MTAPLIRQYLRERPDGARVPDIARDLSRAPRDVENTLNRMPDVYIDRWTQSKGPGGYGAIWCAVEVPEHCPKPERP